MEDERHRRISSLPAEPTAPLEDEHHRRISSLPAEPTAPLWPWGGRETRSESWIDWKKKYEEMDFKARTLSSEKEALRSENELLRSENARLQPDEQLLGGEEVVENGVRGTEIIKCIIYGGLEESINSLRVITAITGAYEGTLNMLPLTTAFVVGGLISILRKMWGLRRDHDENDVLGQTTEYQRILGRRHYFPLHLAIVVLSHMIFGLIPPFVFWRAFPGHESYYKFLAAVPISIANTMALAMTKTYMMRRPPRPYMQIIAAYVLMSAITFVLAHYDGKTFEDD